jgi:large repetitive protein
MNDPTRHGQVSVTAVSAPGRRRVVGWLLTCLCLLSLWFPMQSSAQTIAVSPEAPPAAIIYSPYQLQFSASGGTAPYTFRQLSASAGTLSAAGMFAVTSTGANIALSFDVVDSAGQTSNRFDYTIAVRNDSTTVLSPAVPPAATVGVPYQLQLGASGGTAPYHFSLRSVNGADWLTISDSGLLSGTPPPSSDAYTNITVEVIDSYSAPQGSGVIGPIVTLKNYVLNVSPASALSISPATLPDATLGGNYSLQLSTQGGVAPYGYGVVQGPMPPGLTLSSEGLISGTTFQAGMFPFAVRAVSATNEQVFKTYTLSIAAASLTLSPSSMPQGMAGSRYLQPVAAVGGIAPYAFTLSGRLPTGLTFEPAIGIDGIPLESGTFGFDITATDAGGATVTRTYSMVIVPPPLELYPFIPDAALGVLYSYGIGHNGGLGPFRHVISAGSLPSGMSLGEADGVLSGTPAVAGQFPFEITITDSTLGIQGRGTQHYVLNVSDPDVRVEPASLPNMYLRVPYSVQLSLSVAGPGPALFSVVSSPQGLPLGLTLSPSGLLSGTPTYITFGPIEFTVQGVYPNGVFARRTYRVNVPAAGITLSQLPVATAGAPYSQTVQLVGGIPPYHIAFKVRGGRFGMEMVPGLGLPAGLSISPAVDGGFAVTTPGTFTISGTPTASGDFPLDMEIYEESTRHVEYVHLVVKVLPSQPMITPAILPDASIGLPYSQALTVQGGVAPYRFALAQGSQLPAGLSLSESGVISGTPTVQRTFNFDVTVTDASIGTPGSATTTVTLDVVLPTIVAPSRTVSMVAGVAATVELTEGATGGPFTAASVVSLSPANAGTATIAQSGNGANARYALTFTPASDFSGVATVQYTLSNGGVISAPATIAFTVVPRPDPARDPEVLGLLDAQARSARSFAAAQIGNLRQRLEHLHGAGDGRYGFSDDLTFASSGVVSRCTPRVAARPGDTCAQPVPDDVVVNSRHRQDYLFGTWIGGMLGSGDRDARNGREALDFETQGISGGGDMRIGDGYAGAGIGYGRDRTWVGDNDTRSDAHAYTLSAYGGYAPGDVFFIDGVLGYQSLHYDLRRSLTATAGEVSGRRDGRQWFAALTAGADLERGRWQFMPYGRFEFVRATLDGYREQGDPVYALRYDDQDLRNSSANLGLRVDYRRTTGWGLFAPQLRLEYQHDVERDSTATLRYADWAQGPAYRADVRGFGRGRWEIGLGAMFENRARWTFTFGYRGLLDEYGSDHGLTFDIQHAF